jgi:hypothetical protein
MSRQGQKASLNLSGFVSYSSLRGAQRRSNRNPQGSAQPTEAQRRSTELIQKNKKLTRKIINY